MRPIDWTDVQARSTAVAMCHQAGLPSSELELLRLGSNAVFRVEKRFVLRVMRPGTSDAAAQQEIALVRDFARLGVPTVRLVALPVDQPLQADGCLGTVWEQLQPADPEAVYRQLGELLTTFHERTDDLAVRLEQWDPLDSAGQRLAELDDSYPAADLAMLRDWYQRVSDTLSRLHYVLPPGVIHGQAEVGNVLLRAGQPVLIDFERVALGPPEWDLIDTAVTITRFGRPEARYRAFADASGFDVRAWDGYDTLRRLWELRATTWLMQNKSHGPGVAEQIEVRLQTWRDDDPDARWSGF